MEHLNQLLADTVTLRDLYKKHHWQVLGPTFYPLHLLFDKHAGQQGIRTNEMQVWFLAEHVVETPLVRAE